MYIALYYIATYVHTYSSSPTCKTTPGTLPYTLTQYETHWDSKRQQIESSVFSHTSCRRTHTGTELHSTGLGIHIRSQWALVARHRLEHMHASAPTGVHVLENNVDRLVSVSCTCVWTGETHRLRRPRCMMNDGHSTVRMYAEKRAHSTLLDREGRNRIYGIYTYTLRGWSSRRYWRCW